MIIGCIWMYYACGRDGCRNTLEQPWNRKYRARRQVVVRSSRRKMTLSKSLSSTLSIKIS